MNPTAPRNQIICGDCLDYMRTLPDACVDLVVCSPPYENVRSYGIGFALKGQDWVDWCAERFCEAHRVCRGLVAFVVEGSTRQYRWSATPALLMADLHRRGVKLRKPPLYVRHGIPGSGGPDWLKNRYEFIVCASHGRLPWSDNTAMGKPPAFGPGGEMSNRDRAGTRRTFNKQTHRRADGSRAGEEKRAAVPTISNPGNMIDCGADTHFGFGNESEAPFHPLVAEYLIRSFCEPGGLVFDPFCGSGTTLAQARKHGRDYLGVDIRQSQVKLSQRHVESLNNDYAVSA